MEIYAASDGYVLQLQRSLADYSTVDDLTKDIAPHLGIDSENVLLFLEDGREVKDRVLLEALDRGGSGQGSEAKSEVLFLFNRETFWTEPEIWADKCKEDLFLPPLIDPDSIQDVSEAHQPFYMAQDHIHHILSLFAAQYKALSLAYQNLDHHLAPLRDEWTKLSQTADERLREHSDLLDSAPNDLAILPLVPIHPAFWAKRDSAGNVVSRGKDEAKEKTLADYIHARKMEEVIDTCRASHDDIQGRYRALAGQMEDLLQMAGVEQDRAEQSANVIRQEFDQALRRTEEAIGSIAEASQDEHFLDVTLELEEIMRNDLDHLTALKNDYTLELHIHLRQVALMESRIAEVIKPLTTLETDFKSRGAFPHLTRLHNLPFAYISLVLEYRWRRQFGGNFAAWCKQLNEAVGTMLLPERERRAEMNKDISNLNFITSWGIKESSTPHCEFTIVSGAEVLEKLIVDDTMLDELDHWVNNLAKEVEASMSLGPKRNALLMTVEQLVERYHDLRESIRVREQVANDQSWDTKVIAVMRSARDSGNGDDTSLSGTTPSGQDRQLLDEMELRHREEMDVMEQQQLTMQEELDRLRANLGGEVIARQALTAELDERNRLSEDRSRDQEDQTDFITFLQADMAQEKDRATDLGVRLQEALLDVDGLKNTEQTLLAQLADMRDERTKHFQATSDAQAVADELRSRVAGLQAELESVSKQLVSVQTERDAALKNQSAEAERLMRDRIAEADGDRAVLEHHNVNLAKQVEDLKIEHAEKLNAVRNNATRQADGFKAELAMSKAQLREAQRREAVLSDEVATTRDTATAAASERAHQVEVARDAVALATKYYDTCRPLLRILNAAATSKRAGSDEAEKEKERDELKTPSPPSATQSTVSLRESVLIRSLASAQQFDLEGFTETVNKVVIRCKRYQKAFKHTRDLCKNKISFTDFQKGDLALFLPTRDPSRRHWAAFNVNAPHHFLKADEKMQEEAKSRDWIMARITSSEEAVAGETSDTNPIGLTTGLRYMIHGTEPFDPSVMPRNPRRPTSMGMNSLLLQETSPTSVMGLSVRPVLPPYGRQSSGMITGLPSSLRELAPLAMSPSATTSKSEGYFPPMMPAVVPQIPEAPVASTPTPASSEKADTIFSPPVQEATVPAPSAGHIETPPADKPSLSPVSESTPATVPMGPPPIRTSRYRTSSRSTLSPTSRETPLFAPSSLGRPASVASSHSTHSRGMPIGIPGGKAAPAMAITSSTGSGNFSPGSQGWAVGRPPSGSSLATSQRDSASGTGTGTGSGATGSPLGLGTASTTTSTTSGFSSMARTISRGFSIKPQRSSSGEGGTSGSSVRGKQSAADILKQYGESR